MLVRMYLVRTYNFYRLRSTSAADLVVFFFSSRRRHTRLQGDWSSDVCSSDLVQLLECKVEAIKSLARFVCLAVVHIDALFWEKQHTRYASCHPLVFWMELQAADRKSVV